MTTSAYMLIALIIASGSCQEPRIIVQKMASLNLCQAASNLATKGGIGERNAPTAPTGPRRKSSSSIVLNWVIGRIGRASTGPALHTNQVPTDDACKRR